MHAARSHASMAVYASHQMSLEDSNVTAQKQAVMKANFVRGTPKYAVKVIY